MGDHWGCRDGHATRKRPVRRAAAAPCAHPRRGGGSPPPLSGAPAPGIPRGPGGAGGDAFLADACANPPGCEGKESCVRGGRALFVHGGLGTACCCGTGVEAGEVGGRAGGGRTVPHVWSDDALSEPQLRGKRKIHNLPRVSRKFNPVYPPLVGGFLFLLFKCRKQHFHDVQNHA